MVNDFRNKKVLVVGLGTLGGGIATVKWLLSQGAKVTVTDLKNRIQLKDAIHALRKDSKRIHFVLGKHDEKDFVSHDVIIVNPAVKIRGNRLLASARKRNIPIINDLSIFLSNSENLTVAVTGTRGKTTTTNWIAYLLSKKFKGAKASGNSSDDALLKLLPRLEKDRKKPAILELSSFQLETADISKKAPDIAVITNIYRDHLNRHGTMREYARVKANIFKNQTKDQKLILNADNEWTDFFLKMRPKAEAYFVSCNGKKITSGLRFEDSGIIFYKKGIRTRIFSGKEKIKIESLGKHNVYNFLFAALVVHTAGVSWKKISGMIDKLPVIRYRQEIVIKKKNLIVINDTTATSPEGAIAGLERFGGEKTFFIAGGTDKKLEYGVWSQVVKKNILPAHLFLLDGSATKKMIQSLKKINYFKSTKPQVFENLETVLLSVKELLPITNSKLPITILFSPGAASFEKFKNEFDRGEKFEKYSKKIFK